MSATEKENSDSLNKISILQNGSVADETGQGQLYEPPLRRTRKLSTMLFMSLSIASVPFGIGSNLMNAIYGGGQLSMFVGLLVVLALDGCVAVSLAELASRYPTSSAVYHWTYRLLRLEGKNRRFFSFLAGWLWVIGHWTITLSVNFGFATLVIATISTIFQPAWTATPWEQLLIFYAMCVLTFTICATSDRLLPVVDTVAAACTVITSIAVAITLSVMAQTPRHSAPYSLGHFDPSLSGWGNFGFFIGLLPPAYTFSALGMGTSMAEECTDPEVQVPKAISLVPVIGGVIALIFVLPICVTLPPLAEVAQAPYGQALPYILYVVTGSRAAALVLMILVLLVTLFCSISISTTASRCTWAFARDNGIPLSGIWSRTFRQSPLPALCLVTVIEMLLGLINLGSTSAFTAFASVGVVALAMSYSVPIAISLSHGREEVAKAHWAVKPLLGAAVNIVALLWIAFQLVLFDMPAVLPVTPASMNYASVVFAGCVLMSIAWYAIHGRKRG